MLYRPRAIPVRRLGAMLTLGPPDAAPSMPSGVVRGQIPRLAFRWFVVARQAATLLITWTRWQVHALPPVLPAVTLPSVSLGPALLLSLAVLPVAPVAGMILHTALVVYAFLTDQTRIQPEIISLVF